MLADYESLEDTVKHRSHLFWNSSHWCYNNSHNIDFPDSLNICDIRKIISTYSLIHSRRQVSRQEKTGFCLAISSQTSSKSPCESIHHISNKAEKVKTVWVSEKSGKSSYTSRNTGLSTKAKVYYVKKLNYDSKYFEASSIIRVFNLTLHAKHKRIWKKKGK